MLSLNGLRAAPVLSTTAAPDQHLGIQIPSCLTGCLKVLYINICKKLWRPLHSIPVKSGLIRTFNLPWTWSHNSAEDLIVCPLKD